VYIVAIPIVVLSDGKMRHLPRVYSSIADIISWIYDSSLVQDDAFEVVRGDESGKLYERWHMEARLRLKEHNYAFGQYESRLQPGKFCIGIDKASNVTFLGPLQGSSPFDWVKRLPLWHRKADSTAHGVDTEKAETPTHPTILE